MSNTQGTYVEIEEQEEKWWGKGIIRKRAIEILKEYVHVLRNYKRLGLLIQYRLEPMFGKAPHMENQVAFLFPDGWRGVRTVAGLNGFLFGLDTAHEILRHRIQPVLNRK